MVCFHCHLHSSYKNRTATVHDVVGLSQQLKAAASKAELQQSESFQQKPQKGLALPVNSAPQSKKGQFITAHTQENPGEKGGLPCLEEEMLEYSSPPSVLLSQKLKLKKKKKSEKRRTACKQHWWGLTVWDLLVKARGVCAVIPTSHHGCSPR